MALNVDIKVLDLHLKFYCGFSLFDQDEKTAFYKTVALIKIQTINFNFIEQKCKPVSSAVGKRSA